MSTVNSSIYSQYSHLNVPISNGSLVYAEGEGGPVLCRVTRLMADALYVKTVSCKSRLSSLLRPSNVWNAAEDA